MSRFRYPPQDPTEPKLYIHYRVYGPDGAIRAKTAASPTDPYLACILTTSIPPPHKISTLKRCIVAAEGLNGLTTAARTELYLTLDSSSASNEQNEVAILQSDRPGATPETALVLVHHEELQGAMPRQMPSTIRQQHLRQIYYRLFTRTDRDTSKLAIYSNETSIGRVPRLMLPVPHNRTSIRRFIAQAEGRQILNASEFYENIAAQETLNRREQPFIGQVLYTDGVDVGDKRDGPPIYKWDYKEGESAKQELAAEHLQLLDE
ncbi:hypothetical protein R3P38DRAFT_2933748 [Favolaschia claudopus]|uniref:Uncharacterized protein n=1 Tax=Favolaschia claudopus TaxID=2862362 RepID=A0AAW0BU55_9AGAR